MTVNSEHDVREDGTIGGALSGVILVVDDESDICNLVSRILREQGYSVVTAADGRDALSQVARFPIRLILCNLRMPFLDGESLYNFLARISEPLSQRVAFFSGYVAPHEMNGLRHRSGRPYLEKPCTMDELVTFVNSHVALPAVLDKRVIHKVEAFLCQTWPTQPFAVNSTPLIRYG